jgi:hypothetical protein
MAAPLTDEELAELEAEVRALSTWALDESDVRLLTLRRRAFEELRRLRQLYAELSSSEAELRARLQDAQTELATVRDAG